MTYQEISWQEERAIEREEAILDEQRANGEISEEEYAKALRELYRGW